MHSTAHHGPFPARHPLPRPPRLQPNLRVVSAPTETSSLCLRCWKPVCHAAECPGTHGGTQLARRCWARSWGITSSSCHCRRNTPSGWMSAAAVATLQCPFRKAACHQTPLPCHLRRSLEWQLSPPIASHHQHPTCPSELLGHHRWLAWCGQAQPCSSHLLWTPPKTACNPRIQQHPSQNSSNFGSCRLLAARTPYSTSVEIARLSPASRWESPARPWARP
mmetsp:Transcript_135292/g.306054  ORF Transcript_135292/g.306054 Transcript_135292/m.306054 type:complete len:221 (-) Transcript_135292:240-902(-)